MNCEECQHELGAYSDGELDRDAARSFAAHLRTCAACGAAYETFKRAHAAYSFYRRDIDIDEFTPKLWAAVKSACTPERPAASPAPPSRLARQLVAFARALNLRPALAGALALIVFAVLLGLLKLSPAPRPLPLAARIGSADEPKPPVASAAPPLPAPAPASVDVRSARGGLVALRRNEARRRGGALLAAGRKRVGAGGATQEAVASAPTSAASPAGVATYEPVAEARLFAGTRLVEPWAEPRKHFERSQLLLRSFRNSKFALGAGLTDFAYEKQQSRQLLSQNVALRRAAAARGNLLEEGLLNDLGSILRDIADLPASPSRDEIDSIKRHIEQSEIVADLQIYAAQTSTSPIGY